MAVSIPNEQVLKAIVALHHYEQKRPPAKKTALVPENGLFWLIISLKKIPQAPKRPIRVPLQHSLNPLQETDVCLITKDNKKSIKDLLSCHDVTFITKVIPVDKLKTDFKTFERKRSLCSSFNVFLSDGRIYHRLPKLLGKTFYSRKRFPFPVDIVKKDLKSELELALSSTYVYLGLGQCIAVPVGRTSFSPEEVNSNVQATLAKLSARLPGGWKQVQCVHVKTHSSVALPLYKSLPDLPSKVEIEGSAVTVNQKRPSSALTTGEDENASEHDSESEDHVPKGKKMKRTMSSMKKATTKPLRIRGSRIKSMSRKKLKT